MEEWNKGKWVFKDVFGFGYPYILIHPYKQRALKHLIDNKPDWTAHIIVFGSSVRVSHLWWKDFDVCLIGSDGFSSAYEMQKLKVKDVEYDFLLYRSLEEILACKDKINDVRGDIFREGVLVYGRRY